MRVKVQKNNPYQIPIHTYYVKIHYTVAWKRFSRKLPTAVLFSVYVLKNIRPSLNLGLLFGAILGRNNVFTGR